MANYATLKAAIQQVIKTNGNEEITGNILQQVLVAIVNSFVDYYIFAGVAEPSTNPGTPDQNIFYLAATPGQYPNFGATVENAELAVFCYNGSWQKSSFRYGYSSIEESNAQDNDEEIKVLDNSNNVIVSINFTRSNFKKLQENGDDVLTGNKVKTIN